MHSNFSSFKLWWFGCLHNTLLLWLVTDSNETLYPTAIVSGVIWNDATGEVLASLFSVSGGQQLSIGMLSVSSSKSSGSWWVLDIELCSLTGGRSRFLCRTRTLLLTNTLHKWPIRCFQLTRPLVISGVHILTWLKSSHHWFLFLFNSLHVWRYHDVVDWLKLPAR